MLRQTPPFSARRRLHARLIFAVAVLAVCPSCLSLIQPPQFCFSSAHSFRPVLLCLPFRQLRDILSFILFLFLLRALRIDRHLWPATPPTESPAPVPVRQTHSLFIPIPIPAQTTLLLFIFDDPSALARTTALASLDFHPIARMTRIWNRSDCPACSVGAGLDGSIASRPRAPAVSEPCRSHQPDMAHQHHFTSDLIRKATNSASASSHIRRPRSMRAGRQARRPHETTRAVEHREITTIGPVAMLDARDAQVGGTR